MKSNNKNFHQHIYLEELKIINGISFTKREIDIISFFICGRSAKKCAHFFGIAPKTVENHTHNIMLKMGCNSREGIIDFIEKSDKLLSLRRYYTAIFVQTELDKCLKNVAHKNTTHENVFPCIIMNWGEGNSPNFLISYLEVCLNTLGVHTSIETCSSFSLMEEYKKSAYVIYLIPENPQTSNLSDKEFSFLENNKNSILFSYPNNEAHIKIFDNLKMLNTKYSSNMERCCSLILIILKHIFPNLDWENITESFKREYKNIELTETTEYQNSLTKKEKNIFKKFNFLCKNRYMYLLAFTFLIAVIFFIIVLKFYIKQEPGTSNHSQANLITFMDSAHIDRPELIAQIDDRFKGWSGIQTIALVGIEGAGKTTLARSYISSQNLPNTGEINAESKEALNESFEKLAKEFATTAEDKKILDGILNVKIISNKEQQVIQFVKERLKGQPNWLLLYDNVESFADIQEHFPKDPHKWGQGRIILTTRDSNIENNKHVNNIIMVGDLRDEQKLDLFIKIMNKGNVVSFTASQKEEARQFLTGIPSFPLDISVAAYYLKATHISYQDYLKNINMCNTKLSDVQKKILEEAADYKKTRHSIITLTLKKLIETDKNFKDLLLFISLLDSQGIPRELFKNYKADAVVDNFIYHLKKYSLIAYKDSATAHSGSSISLHRSIQKAMLTHLLRVFEEDDYKKAVQQQACALENYMKESIDKEDFEKMKYLSKHSEHFLMHKDMLSHNERGSLSGQLGCIYYYLCDYPRAEDLLNTGIIELARDFEKNRNKIAHFKVYLGNVYRRLGEYEKAKELFEQSIDIYEQNSKPPIGIARAYGYLGVVYESLGKYERAKELLEVSLAMYEKDSRNSIGLAWSLAHLGSVYKKLDGYEKARELYEKSLKIYKDASINHVGAAWVCENLGGVYVKLKDFEKARKYLEESISIHHKHFSKDHIYIANDLIQLGIFYRETKDYENAKNYLKKGLVTIELSYGKDHHKVGEVLYHLSFVYLQEGKLDIAENTIKRAYDIFLKDKHPNQCEALEILGDIYIKRCESAISKREAQKAKELKNQAADCFTKALEIARAYFPTNSAHIERIHSKIQAITHQKEPVL